MTVYPADVAELAYAADSKSAVLRDLGVRIPPSALAHAMDVALRSPLLRFHTGAVLLDRSGRIVSSGWSHRSETRMASTPYSIHAEHHALRRSGVDVSGGTAVVATRSRRGNWTNSHPCSECARLLTDAGIEHVIYTTPGGWNGHRL